MFKVTNTNSGVNAVLTGFDTKELSEKIAECQSGECACSCSPEIMQKIQNIEVSGQNNETTIRITGDVKAEELEPMMKECLL